MSLFFRVSGIVLTLVVFLGCGFLIGAHKPSVEAAIIQPISSTQGVNTRTGQVCTFQTLPTGWKTSDGTPQCADIAKMSR